MRAVVRPASASTARPSGTKLGAASAGNPINRNWLHQWEQVRRGRALVSSHPCGRAIRYPSGAARGRDHRGPRRHGVSIHERIFPMLAFMGIGPVELVIVLGISIAAIALLVSPSRRPYAEDGLQSSVIETPQSRSWREALFSFRGRIPRRVYWGLSILVHVATAISLFAVLAVAAAMRTDEESARGISSPLALVIFAAFFWSSLAIATKRWHDRDKSGLWTLIMFIPAVGPIWAFIETGFLRGTVGPNTYGPDPT